MSLSRELITNQEDCLMCRITLGFLSAPLFLLAGIGAVSAI